MDRSTARYVALAALLLFVLLFVGLSIDVMARLWAWRSRFSSLLDVALIFCLEAIRSVVISTGVAIAALAASRASRFPAAFALAFGIGFATLAYAKVSAFDAFPGDVQERMALWFGARGVTPAQLTLVFGHPEWAAWLALAGLLHFAARYPRPITADDIARSGAHDRAGALRSVALAGTDVGALARNAATAAVAQHLLSPRLLWSSALLLAALHTTLLVVFDEDVVINMVASVMALLAAALLIALVRAGMSAADESERQLLWWLRRGTLYGGALFVAGALLTQLLPATPLGAVTLALAPVTTVACWLPGVRSLR